jgi:hypothetical protein
VPALILKRGDFEANGAHAIWLNSDKIGKNETDDKTGTAILIRTAILDGSRPWNRRGNEAAAPSSDASGQ